MSCSPAPQLARSAALRRAGLNSQYVAEDQAAELPPLIKGYLRVGAHVCGEPAWDPDFNTADLLMLLPLAQLNPRHARHYLGDAAARAVFALPTVTA